MLGDGVAPVAALRDILRVAETLHQHRPGLGDARRIPADRRRLAGKAVAGQRGDHEVEGIRRRRAMRLRIGQRADDLELLDDRAGPAVRDDHRQCVFVLRAHVDEVDVEAVDLGDEIRHCVQPGLHLAPVVGRPSAARVAASSRVARPASYPAPAPCLAIWSPGRAGADRRGPPAGS